MNIYYSSVAQTVGVEVKFLTPEQVKEAWPMCDTSGLIGAIQHPDDGYIQSKRFDSGACQR